MLVCLSLSACLSVLLWALLLFVAAILIFSKQLSVTSSGAEKLQCLGLPREFGSLGVSSHQLEHFMIPDFAEQDVSNAGRSLSSSYLM